MRIGILSIQGLPAQYGAFEQTVDQIVKLSSHTNKEIVFYVSCIKSLRSKPYLLNNVVRIFTHRSRYVGVIIYGLVSFIKMYCMGIRRFLIMGIGLAPFVKIFEILGCKIVLNVDGFEYRRAKWGALARSYFRLCEWIIVRTHASLIYDSSVISRYYQMIHSRRGTTLFYGADDHSRGTTNALPFDLIQSQYYIVVMRLEPENHIYEIVKAFIESETKHNLVIVGPSTPFFDRKVYPLIKQHRSASIKWLGPVYDRAKLNTIRSNALAYIHGHSVGGTNPTLVEACALGRPIMAYDSSFNREVLSDCALYFRDIDSLTKLINLRSEAYPIPPSLSKLYSWEYIANEYIKLLLG